MQESSRARADPPTDRSHRGRPRGRGDVQVLRLLKNAIKDAKAKHGTGKRVRVFLRWMEATSSMANMPEDQQKPSHEFLARHAKPYDPATDDYERPPFAADIKEGKNDPIYNAHSYHTKVPPRSIIPYILHYTQPGDLCSIRSAARA